MNHNTYSLWSSSVVRNLRLALRPPATRRFKALVPHTNGETHTSADKNSSGNALGRPTRHAPSAPVTGEGLEAVIQQRSVRHRNLPYQTESAVLFCDLRGFTAFAESAPAADVMRLLSSFHETVDRTLQPFDATLDHRAGDGVMLTVGGRNTCPSHIIQTASHLALTLKSMVQKILDPWRIQGHALGVGMGLTFGTITVGVVGLRDSMAHIATGRNVNLASRLCDIAADGEILVDTHLARRLRQMADVQFLSTRQLRGLSKPVDAFNLLKIRDDVQTGELPRTETEVIVPSRLSTSTDLSHASSDIAGV